MLNKINEYLKFQMGIFVKEKTTKALFQASVILAGAILIGAKDVGSFLYKEEISAYEKIYKVEEKNSGISIHKLICSSLKSGIAECKLAQHQFDVLKTYNFAFAGILKAIYTLFIICFAGFIISFLIRPLVEKSNNE